jgi:soluble lytic murein transglycosylase-like protein
MDSSPAYASFDDQAAQSPPPGCLSRLIPLFSILLVSILLYLGFSQVKIGQAEGTSPVDPNLSLPQKGIAPIFTPEVQLWEEKILAWSASYHLDPDLVATVMQIESCGYVRAESSAGARGLFQVMPYHFHEGEDPFHPGTNAKRGLKYLRMSQEAGGTTRLTLAGYNGGITGAQQPQDRWNDEMVRYVYWGYQIFLDAKAGLDHSPRLEEWLHNGGAYLCQLARNNN